MPEHLRFTTLLWWVSFLLFLGVCYKLSGIGEFSANRGWFYLVLLVVWGWSLAYSFLNYIIAPKDTEDEDIFEFNPGDNDGKDL